MQLFVWNDTMREKIPVKVVPATDVDFGLTQKWQSQWTTLAAQGMPNKVALHRCDDNELLGLMSYQINEKGMAVEVVYVESAGHSNANLLRQSGRKQSGTSYQVKDPDASIQSIKLAAIQASGYQTPAAGLRSTPVGAKRVPLAHSTAKWTCHHVRLARCPRK